MRWTQGREAIDGMLERRELERVSPNRDHADLLLGQARDHVNSAELVAGSDPVGAYQMLYDAARKALCAVLENQGLRATSRGGHIAVFEAITAQLDPPLGRVLRPFDRIRRQRNNAEYPRPDSPRLRPEDIRKELPKITGILDLGERVVEEMGPY